MTTRIDQRRLNDGAGGLPVRAPWSHRACQARVAQAPAPAAEETTRGDIAMSTASKIKPSLSFEVVWDDRAGGFRIETYDEASDSWTSLPSATDTDHPLYAGTCAAVVVSSRRSSSDRKGLVWIQCGEEDLGDVVRRAASAAAAALAPLTKGEMNALYLARLGLTPGKRFAAMLRTKHLIDDAGKITPAGVARCKRGSS